MLLFWQVLTGVISSFLTTSVRFSLVFFVLHIGKLSGAMMTYPGGFNDICSHDISENHDDVYGWTGHRYPPNVSAGAESTFDHTTI